MTSPSRKDKRYAVASDEEEVVLSPKEAIDERPTSLVLEGNALESSVTVSPEEGEGDAASRMSALDRKFTPSPDEEEVVPTASTGEKVQAFGQGATEGAIRSGAFVAGAGMGAAIGAAVGGPLAPITAPIGGVVGGLAGMAAGDPLQRLAAKVDLPGGTPLTFASIESVPLHLRPYAVAGETLGGSAPIAAVPYALIDKFKYLKNLPQTFLDRAITAAAETPGWFAATELTTAISAASAGGLSEQWFPGNVYARLSGEVAGGAANPLRWVVTGTRAALARAGNAIPSIREMLTTTPESQYAKATESLLVQLEAAGENPATLAGILRESAEQFPDLKLTAGQASMSPTLLAWEARLERDSAKFGSDSLQMAKDAVKVLSGSIKALEDTGNPQALRIAAQMKSDLFHTVVGAEVNRVKERALEAAARIRPKDAVSRAEFGREMQSVVDDSTAVLRRWEDEAWTKAAQDFPMPADVGGILGTAEYLRTQRLPTEKFSPVVENFLSWLKQAKESAGKAIPEQDVDDLIRQVFAAEGKNVTGAFKDYFSGKRPLDVEMLVRARSRFLALARDSAKSSSQTGPDDARVYGMLAEAALDDLVSAGAATTKLLGARVGRDGVSLPTSYDKARELSATIHDLVTRTVAGDVRAVDASGARRIPPEVVLIDAFKSGREVGALNFQQLADVAERAGPEYLARAMESQRNFILYTASKVVDPISGHVNPRALAKFRSDNAEVVSRLKIDHYLKDAQQAEQLFRSTKSSTDSLKQAVKEKAAFSTVLSAQDPTLAVSGALRGRFPEKDFAAMARLAKGGGPDAVSGFRTATYSYAYDAASTEAGAFSFAKYHRVLNEPLYAKGPSLKELLIREKIVTKGEAVVLDRFNRKAAEIELAVKSRTPEDLSVIPEDALNDFIARLSGVHLVSKLGLTQGAGPGSLTIAGAAARTFKQLFDQMPHAKMKEAQIALAKDPALMARLLESTGKTQSFAAFKQLALQINAFAWNAGLIAARGRDEDAGP